MNDYRFLPWGPSQSSVGKTAFDELSFCHNSVSPSFTVTIKNALLCGATLAGGFAHMLCDRVFTRQDNSQIVLRSLKSSYGKIRSYFQMKGDVDLFFTSQKDAFDTLAKISPWYNVERSVTGAALSLTSMTSPTTIQIVTEICGSPREILDTFDLANSKVALTYEGVWFDSRLPDLLIQRRILVDRWTDFTPARVLKWSRKQNLNVHPSIVRPLIEKTIELLVKQSSNISQEELFTRQGRLSRMLKNAIDDISLIDDQTLLMMRLLAGQPEYDWVTPEIEKRFQMQFQNEVR